MLLGIIVGPDCSRLLPRISLLRELQRATKVIYCCITALSCFKALIPAFLCIRSYRLGSTLHPSSQRSCVEPHNLARLYLVLPETWRKYGAASLPFFLMMVVYKKEQRLRGQSKAACIQCQLGDTRPSLIWLQPSVAGLSLFHPGPADHFISYLTCRCQPQNTLLVHSFVYDCSIRKLAEYETASQVVL